ncbi:MAG: hypothetical protein ACD_10C00906G0002 [uncultured bacterium]|nr:MAG: hypothetical protein ACD_10C00906G0002 [uncultured bacterium]
MRRAERIVGGFAALGKAGQAAFAAQGADTVAPPGEDFMRIALVADIPDDLVARGVEDGVQGDGEFDDAQTGTQMAAGDRHRRDGFGA